MANKGEDVPYEKVGDVFFPLSTEIFSKRGSFSEFYIKAAKPI